MVRTRGGDRSSGSGHGRPDCDFLRYLEDRVINTPVEAKTYPCITKNDEMSWHLAVWGIQLPNFAYEFSIVEGARRLSDIKEGFLLHLHVLDAGFHLPFHPFFYHLLEEYGISPREIVWFLVVGRNCVFHKLFSLKWSTTTCCLSESLPIKGLKSGRFVRSFLFYSSWRLWVNYLKLVI